MPIYFFFSGVGTGKSHNAAEFHQSMISCLGDNDVNLKRNLNAWVFCITFENRTSLRQEESNPFLYSYSYCRTEPLMISLRSIKIDWSNAKKPWLGHPIAMIRRAMIALGTARVDKWPQKLHSDLLQSQHHIHWIS